ncbi:MAG: efflux RND transporter permease subunit, partial [Bradymonadaceae bacterium]
FRVGDQTPLEVSSAVETFVDNRKEHSSPKVDYTIWNDSSDLYSARLNLMLDNAWLGLILVLLVLGLFLQIRVAFWTTVGIGVSFLGGVLLMPVLGVSLNLNSLFAFMLTLGIVVDDAIVVGESIYTAQAEGNQQLAAAIDGTRRVYRPVVFAVMTTIVAFTPIFFVPGPPGRFYADIPTLVIPIFAVSLIECLFILPAHLAHTSPVDESPLFDGVHRFQQKFRQLFETVIETVFAPLLAVAMRHRYTTLAVGLATLITSIGLVVGGIVQFSFMPAVEGDNVRASVRMPAGTSLEKTREVTDRLVDSARTVVQEAGDPDEISQGTLAEIGTSWLGKSGAHLTTVSVNLVSSTDRPLAANELARRWRDQIGRIPGADTLDFDFDVGPAAGSSISFELLHSNTEVLRRAAHRLAEELRSFEGVVDVDDGLRGGKTQLDLTLKPSARALGLTETSLARQVR